MNRVKWFLGISFGEIDTPEMHVEGSFLLPKRRFTRSGLKPSASIRLKDIELRAGDCRNDDDNDNDDIIGAEKEFLLASVSGSALRGHSESSFRLYFQIMIA